MRLGFPRLCGLLYRYMRANVLESYQRSPVLYLRLFFVSNNGLSTPSSIKVDNSEGQAIETSSLNAHLRLTRKDSLVASSWALCTQSEQVPFQRYLRGK